MNIFTFLKSRIAILDVVNSYVSLKRAGGYWKAPCPFHTEKTGSFTVSPHKDIFYCFGCHESGDIISFVAKIESCSPLQAALLLAERYNVELPQGLLAQDAPVQAKKQYYDLSKIVALWFHKQLLRSPAALRYLEQRSISAASIQQFCIGYFPGGIQAQKQFIVDMAKEQILIDDLVNAQILSVSKNMYYSPFEERIIFPIKDHVGQHCGFGGRVFKENDSRAKYYNSKENEFFQKGEIAFGLDLAKKSIQKKELAFLVEGYTDCIAMAQHGYDNTIATLGTACTLEHLKLISRYTPRLYVLYDGDSAGQQAILRLTQLCWQISIDLFVIQLPPTEDPASYLSTHGSLEPLCEQAMEIVQFFITTVSNDFASKALGDKIALMRKIIDIIQTVEDPLAQELLLSQAAARMGIPLESLKKEITKSRAFALPSQEDRKIIEIPASVVPLESIAKLEKNIFFAIMNNIQLFNSKNGWYLLTFLPSPLRDILGILEAELSKNPQAPFSEFFGILSKDHQQLVSLILVEGNAQVEDKNFEMLLGQLQKKHWKVIVNDIKIRIDQAKSAGNTTKLQELVNEFLTIRTQLLGKDLI